MEAELSRLDAFVGDSYATDPSPPGLKGLGTTSSCPEALLPGLSKVLKLSLRLPPLTLPPTLQLSCFFSLSLVGNDKRYQPPK